MRPKQIASAGEGRIVVLTDDDSLWMYSARMGGHLDKRRQWSKIEGAPWEDDGIDDDAARREISRILEEAKK